MFKLKIGRNRLSSFCLVLTFTTGCELAFVSSVSADEDFFQRGVAAYNKGNYSEALGLFGAAQPQNSENPVYHYYLGNCYVKQNLKKDAIREYKLARDLQPNSQISRYCETALQSLEASVAAGVPGGTTGSSAKVGTVGSANTNSVAGNAPWHPPQVIIFTGDDCPLCDKAEITAMQTLGRYINRLTIVRIDRNATDPKTEELVRKYKVTTIPTIDLVDKDGKLYREYAENINPEYLVEGLSYIAPPADPQSANNKEFRATVERNNQLIATYEQLFTLRQGLDNQIRDIDVQARIQQDRIRQTSRMRFYSSPDGLTPEEQAKQTADAGAAKKKQLTDDFRRKKQALFAELQKNTGAFAR